MVTVVDSFNFVRDFGSADSLIDRQQSRDDEDDRCVVDLLVDQIEFADVIILNKTDLVTREQLDLVTGIIKGLNPQAKLLEGQFGKVPLTEVLNTKRFSMEQAQEAPGWLKELRGEHTPETEEYGISSFVYRARRPFHPERFMSALCTEWPGVLRSKGFFWLATRMEWAGNYSQAGAACRTEAAGFWWAAMDHRDWPDDKEECDEIMKLWKKPWGDRRQEIVIIGKDMDRDKVTSKFDACLLTDEEMALDPKMWRAKFTDPFPVWREATDEQHLIGMEKQ